MKDEAADFGSHFSFIGGDGKRAVLTQLAGEVDGVKGVFEYVVDQSGNLRHQFFRPDGIVNGKLP